MARDGLSLLRLIVTVDAAGLARLTGNATALPSPTLALDGSVIVPGAPTVTLAVVFAMFGVAVLAVIVVVPCPTTVTGTLTLFWFAGIVTDAGTVATVLFDDVRVNVTFEGAKDESVSERFCGPLPETTVMLAGKKVAEAVT